MEPLPVGLCRLEKYPMVGRDGETMLRGCFLGGLDEAALAVDAFLVDVVDKRSFLPLAHMLFKQYVGYQLG